MTNARFVTIMLWLAGLFFLLPGIYAFVAPHAFYDQFATFPPYNRHLIHDIGAFQIGIGAALLLALRWSDALFVALTGAGAAAWVHVVSHIIDHDLGGETSQTVVFGVLAVLLLLAAVGRWQAMRAGEG
jgi:uncharacterized membrane protein